MRIETYPNGGGEVLHMWYDEIKDMNEADQEKVASEFIEEAFIENEEGYARYCCAIVHNAAAYLPDFLEYLGMDFLIDGQLCRLFFFFDKWTAWGGNLGPKLHPGGGFFRP